jgi:chloramphenicol 3-O phosphotransferase
MAPGRIVVLNGAPRSGKSSIARAVQAHVAGTWLNLGVDVMMAATPGQKLPGIGLRPGGERPGLEGFVQQAYAALFAAIAAHSRAGLDVVADFGLHDDYARPLGILDSAVTALAGLPVLFVGVRCSLAAIMARRNADSRGGYYAAGDIVPAPVQRWQRAVHVPGLYDLEVDTEALTPEAAAARIGAMLKAPPRPTAFERLRDR